MIYMKQQSLVLHADGIEKAGYLYKMWATWIVRETLPVSTLVGWIEHAIDISEEAYLHNVIINCHGLPGWLSMCGGITINDLDPFKRLRQRQAIGQIYLVACRVHDDSDGNGLGANFCSTLAANSGAAVLAADQLQYSTFKEIPYGHIDDYEGNLYRYDGAGNRDIV